MNGKNRLENLYTVLKCKTEYQHRRQNTQPTNGRSFSLLLEGNGAGPLSWLMLRSCKDASPLWPGKPTSHGPKDLIDKAICEEIVETPDDEARSRLRMAYVLLESFLSTDDWNAVENFKLV